MQDNFAESIKPMSNCKGGEKIVSSSTLACSQRLNFKTPEYYVTMSGEHCEILINQSATKCFIE